MYCVVPDHVKNQSPKKKVFIYYNDYAIDSFVKYVYDFYLLLSTFIFIGLIALMWFSWGRLTVDDYEQSSLCDMYFRFDFIYVVMLGKIDNR